MMVKYVAPILPHVHLRGKEYPNHSFLELGFRDARAVGAVAVLEQPNPVPQLLDGNSVHERLLQSIPYSESIHYGAHIGLTNDLIQAKRAFQLAQEHQMRIAGVKAFWVHSTGNMGITDHEAQKALWNTAAEVSYTGVFFQHCEEEQMFRGVYLPSSPMTHSHRQHSGSELYSVMTQIRNARDAKFKGTFYVAHVSSPETVDFLLEERLCQHPFRIILETTAHHEFLNTSDYEIHGNGVKMNPPLRTPKEQERLLEHVIEGRTDIAGDDHAPHPYPLKHEAREGKNPPSGIPAIAFLPRRVELWKQEGMSSETCERLLFDTANDLFQLGLQKSYVECGYRPELWEVYGYNPFSRVDGTIN